LAIHRALAGVLDGDRRALQLAAAATGPDEGTAGELERAAERARRRGALPSAVPFYERAAELSADPADRARRLTRAAQSSITVGRTERADALAEQAAALTDDPVLLAGTALVRGTVEIERGVPARAARVLPARAAQPSVTGGRTERADALAERAAALADDPVLLAGTAMVRGTVEIERGVPARAARVLLDRAAPITGRDPALALTLLVMAAASAWAAGEAGAVREAARLAEGIAEEPGGADGFLPAPGSAAASVSALGLLAAGDVRGALPRLREAVALAGAAPPGSLIVRLHLCAVALLIGDDAAAVRLGGADAATTCRRGLLGALPAVLQMQAQAQLMAGRHRDAALSVQEALTFARDTGQTHRGARLSAVAARAAAIEGDAERCRRLAERSAGTAESAAAAECALGLLDLVSGRPAEALRRFGGAMSGPTRATGP